MLRVGLHLGWGVATAAVFYPLLDRPKRLELKRRWSAQLLLMLGLGCRVAGAFPSGPRLVVANHVSWLDIFVLNSISPAAFVCKADVRDWPVIGWLCEKTETVFLPRGSRSAARDTAVQIAQRLTEGWLVAAFPEGTTSEGQGVLPFHSALLQGALDAQKPVQPVGLRYLGSDGKSTGAAAYCGETSLLQSLWRIAQAPAIVVDVQILPPITDAVHRRELSSRSREQIVAALAGGEAISAASAEAFNESLGELVAAQ
ncbi:1-acyl-sn-glycerol-3-phosphate acyltransferase [Burkholderiales bacterium]|nr:1-acyl-sn-glycerol-3-phosphate acyltransferase [Burkholderiales bacterium]